MNLVIWNTSDDLERWKVYCAQQAMDEWLKAIDCNRRGMLTPDVQNSWDELKEACQCRQRAMRWLELGRVEVKDD